MPIVHVVFGQMDEHPLPEAAWSVATQLAATQHLDVEVIIPIASRRVGFGAEKRLAQALREFVDDEMAGGRPANRPRPSLVRYVPLPGAAIECAAMAVTGALIARPKAVRPFAILGSFADEGGYTATLAAGALGCASIVLAHDGPVTSRRSLAAIRRATRVIADTGTATQLAKLGRESDTIEHLEALTLQCASSS